jgi:hypothetical protein
MPWTLRGAPTKVSAVAEGEAFAVNIAVAALLVVRLRVKAADPGAAPAAAISS